MILILSFVCQTSSSNAEMNPLTNMVTIHTQPNPDLNDQEITSCLAQSNQTALYAITIGTNTFRSSLVFYDAFKEAEIVLLPETGSSVEKSLLFFIASYEITFLDSTLIQSGAIGQLLSTLYNLNECLYDQAIDYETSERITPLVSVNPNCKIIPTGDVNYEFSLQSFILQSLTIKKDDFNFSNLVFKSIDCTVGTVEEKENCIAYSKYISGSNFIFSKIKLVIPQAITSQNEYINDYGILQKVLTTYNFILIFNLQISNRLVEELCAKDNQLSFNEQSIYIYQKLDQPCDFVGLPRQEFWVTASELEDNSGGHLQLQFYPNQPYEVNQFIDCTTWEISEYESIEECQKSLYSVSQFPSNMTLQIVYKLYGEKDTYEGADRFVAQNIQSGKADISALKNQLCVHILKDLKSTSRFSIIDIKISSNLKKFQQNEIDFQMSNNFVFPSYDNNYCFSINSRQQRVLNELNSLKVFGIVYVANSVLQIQNIQVLLSYDTFFEGYIFLIGSLLIMLLWIKIKQKIKQYKLKQVTLNK